MLENTDKAVADLLKILPDMIKGAESHLPDIAQQILVYGVYDAKIGIVIGSILAFIAIICGCKWLFSYDSQVSGATGLLLLVISIIFIGCGVSTLYKIERAPKLYLLEKVINYTKKGE